MILYPDQGAGMCNRLFAAAHLIAHSEDSGNPAWLFSLRKYRDYFEGLPQSGIYYHRPTERRAFNLWRFPLSLLRSGRFPLRPLSYAEPEMQAALSAGLTVLIGWRFRDEAALKKHRPLILDFFKPRAEHQVRIDACVRAIRARCDVLVGVHIRRTDYAAWQGGAYYFGIDRYCQWMNQIRGQLPGRVSFLVSSDEPIDETSLPGLDIQKAPGHPLQDLYSLAQCDYIIGPTSTYSAWASFYGSKPLWHIFDADASLQLNDFTIR